MTLKIDLMGTKREKDLKQKKKQSMNKAFWNHAILSILGDCWEKSICSSLPAKLITEFKASTHGGRIGRKLLRSSSYSFELKLRRMVELCIPKTPIFFVFRF